MEPACQTTDKLEVTSRKDGSGVLKRKRGGHPEVARSGADTNLARVVRAGPRALVQSGSTLCATANPLIPATSPRAR